MTVGDGGAWATDAEKRLIAVSDRQLVWVFFYIPGIVKACCTKLTGRG